MARVATIDFHVTSECSQECVYCWGPQGIDPVDTAVAERIIARIAVSAERIVFTGGDPMQRDDIGRLVSYAAGCGLEVALSTTGDQLTAAFLEEHGPEVGLVSLPLDGASEEVSARTKEEGHFGAVMAALDLLAAYPGIDVKVATPVTRHNLTDVPNIVALLSDRAAAMPNRLFYNVFQVFPRSFDPEVPWDDLVVGDDEFAALRSDVERLRPPFTINWLSHETLDKLYVMVFPDGTLTVPVGPTFRSFGPFLEVEDLEELLDRTDFDAPRHLRHPAGWTTQG